MFYLINQFDGCDSYHYGRVMSAHRTAEGAAKAKAKTLKSLGEGQYLPMCVIETAGKFERGNQVRRSEGEMIDILDYEREN